MFISHLNIFPKFFIFSATALTQLKNSSNIVRVLKINVNIDNSKNKYYNHYQKITQKMSDMGRAWPMVLPILSFNLSESDAAMWQQHKYSLLLTPPAPLKLHNFWLFSKFDV